MQIRIYGHGQLVPWLAGSSGAVEDHAGEESGWAQVLNWGATCGLCVVSWSLVSEPRSRPTFGSANLIKQKRSSAPLRFAVSLKDGAHRRAPPTPHRVFIRDKTSRTRRSTNCALKELLRFRRAFLQRCHRQTLQASRTFLMLDPRRSRKSIHEHI